MSNFSDIKLTDQLERNLLEQEIARQDLGILSGLRRTVARAQDLIDTFRSQARRSKVAFANG